MQKGSDDCVEINFGDFVSKPPSIYSNYLSVDQSYDMDELTATLGKFTYAIYVKGSASGSGNSWDVNITSVGVHLYDRFEFNGAQFLGSWKRPNFVTANPISFARTIYNGTYRTYRKRYNKGEDFWIISDVKERAVNESFSTK